MKRIYVAGEITDESFAEFQERLDEVEDSDVELIITSEGGSATAALAYYDAITNSEIRFHGVATGLVASAASLIFIACDHRRMTNNAWFMVHEDNMGDEEMKSVSQREKEALHARRLERQWCQLMAEMTKVSFEKWTELHKNETYLSKQECKELGILDEE